MFSVLFLEILWSGGSFFLLGCFISSLSSVMNKMIFTIVCLKTEQNYIRFVISFWITNSDFFQILQSQNIYLKHLKTYENKNKIGSGVFSRVGWGR